MRINQVAMVRDQVAHFAIAVAVISLALNLGIVGGAIAGLLIGMIREVTEAGNPVTWAKIKAAPTHSDAPLDLAFWALGGGFAAWLI